MHPSCCCHDNSYTTGPVLMKTKIPRFYLKGWKWRYLVFHRKRLEPSVLSWQQLRRCHSLPFVMHISGAKFEEHCSNICRDIVDWVLYCFSGTIYDVNTFLICIIQKRKYLYNEKKIFQKGKCHSFLLWKTFQISSKYFLLHRHFNLFLQPEVWWSWAGRHLTSTLVNISLQSL